MIAWNPRSPSTWASLFGFVAVPLFGPQRRPSIGEHAVLLDGRRSSFTLSRGDAMELLNSRRPVEWAWSSDVPRAVIVDARTDTLHGVRWDQPHDVRVVNRPTPESAQRLLAELELSSGVSRGTAIDRALNIFRSLRNDVREYGGNDLDAIQAFNVLLVAADDLRRDSPALRFLGEIVDAWASRKDRSVPTIHFTASVLSLPIGDLAQQLILEPDQYSLDPYLLIRHAGGKLFQEAHIELERPPVTGPRLFLAFHSEGVPKPPGRARRDVHFTPAPLARFLVEQALQEFRRLNPNANSVIVLDPACGSGVFLTEALRELEGTKTAVSLHGFDSSEISTRMTEFTLAYAAQDFTAAGGSVSVTVRQTDSLQSPWGRPHVILMNPPFLPWRKLDDAAKERVKESLGNLYAGQTDTAVAFLAKAIQELQPGTVLASVLPAAIFYSQAAEPVRRMLEQPGWRIVAMGLLRDYGYFENATVEPAFVVVSRSQPKEPIRTLLAESDAADRALREARRLPPGDEAFGDSWEITYRTSINAQDWTPRPRRALKVVEKLRHAGTQSVTDLFDVHLGIRTGANNVFVVEPDFVRKMSSSERAYFPPLADTIRHGRVRESRFIFYPYRNGHLAIQTEEALRSAVPLFYSERLDPDREQLKLRRSIRERNWWELSEPRKSWLNFSAPRIITMTFGRRGGFAFDSEGKYAVLQGNAWLWKGKHPLAQSHWLAYLAILNSPIFEAGLDYSCPRTLGGQYELASRFLRVVPLPDLRVVDRKITDKLGEYGHQLHQGKSVPLRSINDLTAAALGVSLDDFVAGFPLTRRSRYETDFQQLASEWKRETQMLSSSSQAIRHSAIRRILEMGDFAIPLILRELKDRPTWWFAALQKLTGADPVPEDKKGLLHESADAWLRWAEANGYEV